MRSGGQLDGVGFLGQAFRRLKLAALERRRRRSAQQLMRGDRKTTAQLARPKLGLFGVDLDVVGPAQDHAAGLGQGRPLHQKVQAPLEVGVLGGVIKGLGFGRHVVEIVERPGEGLGPTDVEGSLKRGPADRLGGFGLAGGLKIVDPGGLPVEVRRRDRPRRPGLGAAWRNASPASSSSPTARWRRAIWTATAGVFRAAGL